MTFSKFFPAIALIFSVLASLHVQAQIGIGIKGGVLMSNQTAKSIAAGEQEEIDRENITGFEVGIPIEFGVSKLLAFQTELTYLKQGYGIEENLTLSRPATTVSYDVIEVPVLAKLGWTSKRISLAAVFGPSFQYTASGRVKLEAFSTDLIQIEASEDKIDFSQAVYEDITRTNFYGQAGIQLGAPVAGGKFVFDARYRFALTDQDSSDDVEVKGRGASATIGYIATFGNY